MNSYKCDLCTRWVYIVRYYTICKDDFAPIEIGQSTCIYRETDAIASRFQ